MHAMDSVFKGSKLGLERGVVEIAQSTAAWPATFDRLAAVIGPALTESVTAVEHIGSTAVPGLPAKPVLDIAVGVRPGADPQQPTGILTSLGFVYRGDPGGDTLDRNFGWEDRPRHRLANVHLVTHGGREWRAYIEFRDLLRRDPVARNAYLQLKLDLAARFRTDRKAYVAGKDRFVAATGR
jgi:GrpB-like predicted nucleotidyltransferase (UPF0157 family)